MKFKSNWQGMCPCCNSPYFEYGLVELVGDMCYFPWKCIKCGKTGKEWYNMEFAGHNVNTEDGEIEITHDMLEV